ncbi:MAG: LamG domain-containing protein [Deltaproteobacteria bacterium]|nr:LamG domain-containing protein [Deltaproteobacteria bacterium]
MKLSKYAGITAVLGCAFAYGIVGCGGGGGDDGGSTGGKGGSKTGGKGGSASGGKGGSSSSGGKGGSGSGGSSTGGSSTGGSSQGGSGTGGAGTGGTPGTGGMVVAGDAVLVGYWPFDDDAMDKSGKANNGSVVQGGTENAAASAGVFEAGKKGKAIKLANPTQTTNPVWVKVPRSDSIDLTGTMGSFTITAWVNPGAFDNMDDFNFVISRHEVGTPYEHFGLGTLAGKPTAAVHFFFAGAADAIPSGMWTHIAATYDGITLSVYTKGVLSTSLDVGWPIAADTTHTVIGGNQNTDTVKEAWDGLLDEVRLYAGVVAADKIAAEAQ